jgi:mono/diheme cytochrome c family protein
MRYLTPFLMCLGSAAAILLLTAGKQRTDPAIEQIQRGKYLVTFGGCNDCHTPLKSTSKGPMPDMSRLLSGHPAERMLPQAPAELSAGPWSAATAGMTAWTGPWGVSYASNLTPDENTGMGIWTEYMFINAMRKGKHMGAGRNLLPPMPWRNLAALSDADLRAIFAYLQSIPPIGNRVPDAVPPGGKLVFE